ncbi:MAG: pyrimidine-nucleoside phosphorylase [Clostridia bacterium]|nr:pyrimidine-nucleoside phosphorylase [Clostridia bacterium]
MRMYDIIAKKRDGGELNKQEIDWFISEYTADNIPDYQASALCMAIFFNGMSEKETALLTAAMRDSGDKVDLSCFGGKTADKHSTGGVGDKTTLIVAPVVASLGGYVAKMSGRGLGHTGGTVDKLESIKGFKTTLSSDEFLNQVKNIGIAVIGQSGNLAPADKKLYALRDVTATVNSIPLIASSIMSKKLAAGTDNIVLDVKVGSGAFMKNLDDAKDLAQAMVDIGYNCGKKVSALITNMDVPLGYAIGNALEVKEAAAVLKGNINSDLAKVCIALASNIISLVKGIDINQSELQVKKALCDGLAYNKFLEWITAQGGDVSVFDDLENFVKAEYNVEVFSEADGYITKMDAEKLGIVSVMLGGGRATKDDEIDFKAGLVLAHKTGDLVKKGEKIATLYSNTVKDMSKAVALFNQAIVVGEQKPLDAPLVYEVVTKDV